MRRAISLVFAAMVLLTSLSLKQDSFYFEARKYMMDVCWSGELSYAIQNDSFKNVQTGTFKFDFPKYHTAFSESSQEVICDGKSLMVILHKEEEVSIMEMEEHFENSFIPMSDKVVEVQSEGDNRHFHILSNDKRRIGEVWIDKGTKIVSKVILTSSQGMWYTYEINDVEVHDLCPESDFEINANKWSDMDYSVYDERE
mgnify:CR=1 FL=1